MGRSEKNPLKVQKGLIPSRSYDVAVTDRVGRFHRHVQSAGVYLVAYKIIVVSKMALIQFEPHGGL